MKTVFETTRSGGGVLREYFTGTAFEMQYEAKGACHTLSVYAPSDLGRNDERTPYDGRSADDVLSLGRDLLTDRLLADGEPSYRRVEALLPRIEDGAYAFFGGATSWSGIELDTASGVLFSQVSENNNVPTVSLFDPASVDETLGKIKPILSLLDGKLPVVFSVHTDGKDVLEFLYFVEAGDPDRDPVVWLRQKRYALTSPEDFTLRHEIVSRSRVIPYHEIAAETFYVALSDTVAYWLRFAAKGAAFHLPEKETERIILGTQIASAVTFSGDHPHYGHRYYGKEMHDHFPPNYLWAIEMCCAQNRTAWARRIVEHLFEYSLTDEGRFVYRQGNDELFGASACEYAQLIWILWRYKRILDLSEGYADQLIGMGDYLLTHLRPCPVINGEKLIYMCAEADSNTRVHAYVNNNLWCVRGLSALADILADFGICKEKGAFFRQSADELYHAVLSVLEKDGVRDERFGALPPFRVGYTATPVTLSACRDTFYPMSEQEYTAYAKRIDMREQGSSVQEYTENCYANYRYYPEMLGTMLLPDDFAKGVLALRENLGGEVLCMTRFMGHLDDWPVLHYARFLLENGYTDKFLTLFYAHACHHGRPDLNCYYEQVTIDGKVMAEDCIPSLLTLPIMAAWMFAYESVANGTLSLLAGIPAAWYKDGFSAENVGTSFGSVSIGVCGKKIDIRFAQAPEKPFRLVLRHLTELGEHDIEKGGEHVLSVCGNELLLVGGAKEISLTLR